MNQANTRSRPPTTIVEWLAGLNIKNIDPAVLDTAVTHPSFRSLHRGKESYERLEFLGDAVLSLVVGEQLFRALPEANEGILTERRAALVNRDALAGIFDREELKWFLHAAPCYIPSKKDKCDVVEAIFGAVFLRGGYEKCFTLWRALVEPNLATASRNAKSVLQEYCQSQRWPLPLYKITSQEGTSHAPVFSVKVEVNASNQIFIYGGTGPTRKDAEMAAAEALCKQLAIS
jgi:ribonuclease-3